MDSQTTHITNTSQLAPGWVAPEWGPQPFETEEQHQAFALFLSLPSRMRNMTEVSRHCAMSRQEVLDLSMAHHWQHRISRYDAFVRGANRDRLRETAQDRAGRHLAIIDKGLEVAEREYNNLLTRQRALDAQDAQVSLLKPGELQALVNNLIKLERLVVGEATERIEETEYDLSQFTHEELIEWRRLMDKAKKSATGDAIVSSH